MQALIRHVGIVVRMHHDCRPKGSGLKPGRAGRVSGEMLEARVNTGCQCTLKNPRWSKLPVPSVTASRIIISWSLYVIHKQSF